MLQVKSRKCEASNNLKLETACSGEITGMYATVNTTKGSCITHDQVKSEYRLAEYTEMDQSKRNKIQKYTDITLTSVEVDNSSPAAEPAKCRMKHALAASAILAGLGVLTMFVILCVKVTSLEMNIKSLSYTQQLEDLKKSVASLNSSNNIVVSLPSSCTSVLKQETSSTFDYYLLRSSSGQLRSVSCDMSRRCGNITGGWMRVAKLDVKSCPLEL